MILKTLTPMQIAQSKEPWKPLSAALKKDTEVQIPIGTPEHRAAVLGLQGGFVADALRSIYQNQPAGSQPIGNQLKIGVTLDSSQQSREAVKILQDIVTQAEARLTSPAAPPVADRPPGPLAAPLPPLPTLSGRPTTITIAQGIKGGVAIGGTAGLSVYLVAEGLRHSAAAIGNPICAALGMVLAGVATGAAAGAAFAKFSEISVKVSPVELQLKGG